MSKATVRLVRRGDEHPYIIEVMTLGWRGVDAAFEKSGKGVWAGAPADLKQVAAILDEATNQPYRTFFIVDGATEFVLKDRADFESAANGASPGWFAVT